MPRSNDGRKIEHFGRNWIPVYKGNQPAMKNKITGKIKIPSENYVSKHHPQGSWIS